MNPKTEELLKKTSQFCKSQEDCQTDVVDELVKLLSRSTFRICVVGGFSRGKSHFLNFLLGSQLLPESALPTTTLETVIRYGEKPRLVLTQNGNEAELELDSDALTKYSALESGNAGGESLTIYCPLPLLKNGMELVDTPGVDDGQGEGAAIACRALLDADAAIVMLSAISPLSLTEKDFIKTYLLDRSIPLIACGVSFLDQIPADRREGQLAYLLRKTDSLYPGMKLLLPACGDSTAKDRKMVCGKEAVEKFLKDWQNLPALSLLREKMALYRLLDFLKTAASSLSSRKALLEKNIADAKTSISNALAEIEDNSACVMDLKVAFMERLDALMESVRTSIENFNANLLASVRTDGFDEDVFYADISKLYNELTDQGAIFLRKDLQLLCDTLRERLGVPADLSSLGNFAFAQFPVTKINLKNAPPLDFIDMAIKRGLDFGDNFAGRLPMGKMLWPLLKPQIQDGLARLRDFLQTFFSDDSSLQNEISKNGARMSQALRHQFEEIYQVFFEVARNSAKNWLMTQKENLSQIHDTKELEESRKKIETSLLECYALRDEAEKRLKEIEESLQ